MEIVGIWIAAILTFCIFSFLYKDNPLYKFAEHLFVGVSAGYWLAYSYWNSFHPNLVKKIYIPFYRPDGDVWLWIAFILTLMMFTKLIPNISWMSRWTLAFIIGASSGMNLVTYFKTDTLMQVTHTIVPLIVKKGGQIDIAASLNNTILFIGICTGLIYFYFSKEHKGTFGRIAKIGIYFLMIAFGAAFGYTVMARISLLIGRMQFLIDEWWAKGVMGLFS